MNLPVMRRAARARAGRRVGAALLVVLALAAMARPGRAASGDPFSATVSVDATAATVVQAREKARLDGQRRALAAVVARLAGGTSPTLPQLDDNAITDLVQSFQVANERMSAVRYLADYTFHFRPAAIERLMADAGVAAAVPPAGQAAANPPVAGPPPGNPESRGPAVLVPLYQAGGALRLWDDPNPWRRAWDEPSQDFEAAHLVIPLGDAGDLAAIDAAKAKAGDPAALAALARHNAAAAAVVALAAIEGPPDKPTAVDVTLRRYRAGQPVGSDAARFAANPGESADDLLHRAVAASISEIASGESGWKEEPVAGYDRLGSLTAVLPIAGLDDWVHVRERIAGLPAVRKIALVALSREEATIEIGYVGSLDQLKAGLAGISLALVGDGSSWRLARTVPTGTR
jgi:Uncharacterized protein conserved in bacteria (DUF2066)